MYIHAAARMHDKHEPRCVVEGSQATQNDSKKRIFGNCERELFLRIVIVPLDHLSQNTVQMIVFMIPTLEKQLEEWYFFMRDKRSYFQDRRSDENPLSFFSAWYVVVVVIGACLDFVPL
jgi:hypothetical protein